MMSLVPESEKCPKCGSRVVTRREGDTPVFYLPFIFLHCLGCNHTSRVHRRGKGVQVKW